MSCLVLLLSCGSSQDPEVANQYDTMPDTTLYASGSVSLPEIYAIPAGFLPYTLPMKPSEGFSLLEVPVEDALVLSVRPAYTNETSVLIDQAPPGGPLNRGQAGEFIDLQSESLRHGIMTLALDRVEPLLSTKSRLMMHLEIAEGSDRGTYTDLSTAIDANDLVPVVEEGPFRMGLTDYLPEVEDPIFGQVLFGDTLIILDGCGRRIAFAVWGSELVVVLAFWPDCNYPDVLTAIQTMNYNGVSLERVFVEMQERLGGGATPDAWEPSPVSTPVLPDPLFGAGASVHTVEVTIQPEEPGAPVWMIEAVVDQDTMSIEYAADYLGEYAQQYSTEQILLILEVSPEVPFEQVMDLFNALRFEEYYYLLLSEQEEP